VLRFYFLVALAASLYGQSSVTSTGIVKFGGQPLPGATVIAIQGDRRTLTTTDESGAYELPDLAPGAYTVEVQMFGFQTARKQIQVGPSSQAPADWSLDLQPFRQQRPQPQQGGFRATAGTTENELDQIAASLPQDTAAPATGNANEAFLVNGSLSKPARMISGSEGRYLECKLPVDCPERASKASPVAFRALPEGRAPEDSAVVDALAVSAAAGLAAREGSAATGQEAMADSLAIAPIADARASTAMSRSSGKATPPTRRLFP